MNSPTHRIPTHDEVGQRIKIGERATVFSRHNIHYNGRAWRMAKRKELIKYYNERG